MGHLKLVDAPLVVCDGGPGRVEAKIWPVDTLTEAFAKIGDGECVSPLEAYRTFTPHVNATGRMPCESQCSRDASCGAYDVCTGLHCSAHCRFYNNRSSYSEVHKQGGFECYVKQKSNATKPHVVTFLRTSNETANVSFVLTDSSPVPKTIIPAMNVTFPSFFSRRLQIVLDEDARRTSAVARRGKGGGHGGGHGGGRGGRGHGGGRANARGRASPGSHARSRGHLASGRTVGGQRAAGRFSNPRNHRAGFYGYGHHLLGKNYPHGFATTSYGLSGRSAYTRHAAVMVASWFGARYFFSRFNSMCHCATPSMCDRCNVVHDVDGSDETEWALEDDLVREDLMTTGFIPDDYQYPLRLTVTGLSGAHYDSSRICPPNGWNPRSTSADSQSWMPPRHQDLFFSVTPMEDLAPERASDPSLVMGIFITVGICAICIPLVTCCMRRSESEEDEEKRKMKMKRKKEAVELPMFRRSYAPLPAALGSRRYSSL